MHDPARDAPMSKVEMAIEGMTCAACAARIEKRLAKQPGVADANVNLAMQTATVRYEAGAIEPAALAQAVEAIGYGAKVRSAANGGNRSRADEADRDEAN